jgi:hypothetical protein
MIDPRKSRRPTGLRRRAAGMLVAVSLLVPMSALPGARAVLAPSVLTGAYAYTDQNVVVAVYTSYLSIVPNVAAHVVVVYRQTPFCYAEVRLGPLDFKVSPDLTVAKLLPKSTKCGVVRMTWKGVGKLHVAKQGLPYVVAYRWATATGSLGPTYLSAPRSQGNIYLAN